MKAPNKAVERPAARIRSLAAARCRRSADESLRFDSLRFDT
jgi:hypothetical protein